MQTKCLKRSSQPTNLYAKWRLMMSKLLINEHLFNEKRKQKTITCTMNIPRRYNHIRSRWSQCKTMSNDFFSINEKRINLYIIKSILKHLFFNNASIQYSSKMSFALNPEFNLDGVTANKLIIKQKLKQDCFNF